MALQARHNRSAETEDSAPELLESLKGFAKVEVCEIMRPRVDVTALDIADSFDEVMKMILEREYSRMPVYEGDLDHIKGILFIKDIILHWEDLIAEKKSFKWQRLLRPAIIVPESKKISELLREFKKKRLHMAVVVDEYGGTSGIVTLEDILEEVVGEINDESDEIGEERLYQRISDKEYLFDGRMPIHDLCKLLDLEDTYFDIEDGDYESLAGLILEEVGYFPSRGTEIPFKDYLFTVENIGQRRITRIRMNVLEDE